MYHVVQPYDDSNDYSRATVVASFETPQKAWDHLDGLHLKMLENGVHFDFVTLLVVDDQRQTVPRPIGMVS
jgi:hypothetical protein